jgi:hypothetical protein
MIGSDLVWTGLDLIQKNTSMIGSDLIQSGLALIYLKEAGEEAESAPATLAWCATTGGQANVFCNV